MYHRVGWGVEHLTVLIILKVTIYRLLIILSQYYRPLPELVKTRWHSCSGIAPPPCNNISTSAVSQKIPASFSQLIIRHLWVQSREGCCWGDWGGPSCSSWSKQQKPVRASTWDQMEYSSNTELSTGILGLISIRVRSTQILDKTYQNWYIRSNRECS